jgi:glutathione S-transferase
MKLYNSIGPNPKTVRMFMVEKGIELPRVEIDIRGGENRQGGFVSKNPAGQTPALELDDGAVLSEITAICEYLDEVSPGPSLIGATPQERAMTRMWVRRIDLNIVEPMATGFRYGEGLRMFENRMRCIPHAAADLKLIAQDKLAWLDGLIAGRDFICGDKLTLADILLFAFLEFGATVGQPVNPDLRNITAWFVRMMARPSAAA